MIKTAETVAPPATVAQGIGGWISLHIFIHDFARLNAFVRAALCSLPSEVSAQSFFIRYWYGGPHIRLRFRPLECRAGVEAHLREYLDANAFSSSLDPVEYYRAYARHLETEVPQHAATPDWFENGSIQAIPYVPEIDRYGGPNGMPLVENYFVKDSGAVLRMLADEADRELEKILFAYCVTHAAVLREWNLELDHGPATVALWPGARQLPNLAGAMREQARTPALRSAYERAQAAELFPRYQLPLRARLRELVVRLRERGVREIPQIISSLLHMSFNRTGIPPAREIIVRWLAAQCAAQAQPDESLRKGADA